MNTAYCTALLMSSVLCETKAEVKAKNHETEAGATRFARLQ